MKNIILGVVITITTLAVCYANNNISTGSQNRSKDSQTEYQVVTLNTVSIKEIISAYLQMKNAFTEDNSIGAASAAKKLEAAFMNFDKSALTAAQKKTFEDVEADAREHAEHIGANSGNIAHQREHFEILSKDIYDLVKTFGAGQVLYKDFDPMYNNGKGAFWLSETKEIKNPYMGKAMFTSGSIKEEIK
jgi:CRISPR/Cas system type I-B associated protein Csh2 (Cas7 group RAMP superfamily)